MVKCDLPTDAPLPDPSAASWAEYVSLLGRGLRSQARRQLGAFLHDLGATDSVEGERFCRWLCAWCFDRGRRGLEFPLIEAVLLPYLRATAARGQMPHLRWLADLRQAHLDAIERLDQDLAALSLTSMLRAAVVSDPRDWRAWRLLFDAHTGEAAYGAHHLDESILILPLDVCLAELHAAREVAIVAPHDALGDERLEELAALERLYDDWQAYVASAVDEPFLEWTARHGRDYTFPAHFYYRA